MATDNDVLDFLKSLFTDSETVKALTANPGQTFEDCRVSDATPNQLNQALATLATSPGALPPALQGRLEAAISSGGGGGLFADVGYRGAVPTVLASASPLVAGYAQTAAALTAVTAPPSIVQQVSNVTNNIDESSHYTDASVAQHLVNIGGTLTNNLATGAGAAAVANSDGATVGTGSGPVLGQDSQANNAIFAGNAPIEHSTLVAGNNDGSISGQDQVLGSHNITDAGVTGSNVDSFGTSATGASQGGLVGGDGNLNVDSPGAANASGLGQAAGGGEGGGEGGVNLGGGNLVQEGQTNVNAPNSLGVQASGGGDNAQNAQNQEGFGTGGDGGGQLQTAQLTPEGGGDGPVYFDQSAPPDPGLGAPDPGIAPDQPQPDPGYSDQPAGTEHTDPLG